MFNSVRANEGFVIEGNIRNLKIADGDYMITIYIHAGAEKTGTSAIQAFLNYNRENLINNHSCLYPNNNSLAIHKGQNCHNHCKSINQPDNVTILEDIEKSINFCKKNDISKIIISAEGFSGRPGVGEMIFKKFQNDSNLSFRLIVFIRRPDHFFESSWKQWGSKNSRFSSIKEYIEEQNIRWLDNLRKFANIFGRENIIVHPYEKEQLPEGLINEFLKIIGICYSEYNWITPPETNLNLNYGFNRDIIEILALNKSFYKNVHDNTLLNFFYNTLPDTYQKKPYERYDLLSPQERIIILEKYEVMTQAIAREFLGREDGKLFYEPWPDVHEPWEPYEGLTVEKIVPIFTQIMYNIDKKEDCQVKSKRKNGFKKTVLNYLSFIKTKLLSVFTRRS